jgi:hypothetical protein
MEHGMQLARLPARGSFKSKPRVEVHHDEMTFFTHRVNGQTYGAWYRHIAPRELEIIGAGLMCKTPYAGSDELSVARSVLEDYVRMQLQTGGHPQSLDGFSQADSTRD